MLNHWREGGGGLPRFPLAGGRLREDMTAQNASKKRISGNVDFLSRIGRTADTKVGGGSAEPHGGYAHRISVRTGHWLGRETSNVFFTDKIQRNGGNWEKPLLGTRVGLGPLGLVWGLVWRLESGSDFLPTKGISGPARPFGQTRIVEHLLNA